MTTSEIISDKQQRVKLEEIFVCNHFGCKKQLTITEQLFGKNCINHVKKGAVNPAMYVSFPIKKR